MSLYRLNSLYLLQHVASVLMAYGWSPFALEYDPVRCGSIDGTDVIPHDRAIVRAQSANYRPNKGVIGDPECTLFVGRLNKTTSESAIEAEFSAFAPVRRVRLVRDVVTGFSRGYAFVEFYDERTTKDVYRTAAGVELDNKQLLVELECERTLRGWVPRRLGGGFGGRKEAGQLRFGGHDRPFRKPIFVHPPNRSDISTNRERLHSATDDFKQHSSEEKYGKYDKSFRSQSTSDVTDDSRSRQRSKRRETDYENYSRESHQSHNRHDSNKETQKRKFQER